MQLRALHPLVMVSVNKQEGNVASILGEFVFSSWEEARAAVEAHGAEGILTWGEGGATATCEAPGLSYAYFLKTTSLNGAIPA